MPFIRWMQAHRRLARLIPYQLRRRLVWRDLYADPEFMAAMERSGQEFHR